jgi:spore coat polysaccharide biosynthesis predicted glycosyltransferase SpsG
MFLKSAQAARDAGCTVIVSTDDPEIRSTAVVAGFSVHDRGPELADCVVDDVVKSVVEMWGWDGPVLLVQPTVQPITADILTQFLGKVEGSPTSLVQPQTHQLYRNGWLTERVNRQDAEKGFWQEVGIRWWQFPDDIGKAPEYVVDADYGLVDIDTAADYRSITAPRRIALWPIADDQHGMGHLRRCLAIAERLQHHDVRFITDDIDPMIVKNYPVHWPIVDGNIDYMPHGFKPDLWILDRLDNDDMPHLPGNVLALEDNSNYQSDAVINAMYQDGADWCVLRPEFLVGDYQVRDTVETVMVMFGGTDPTGLGLRVTELVEAAGVIVVHVPPGVDWPVAEQMHLADMLITSAGRTVFEAAAVGVPTIVLAQNVRETTHTHLGLEHGNIYLGLGKLVTDQTIVDTVRLLSNDIGLRTELSGQGRPDGKGLDRILWTIDGLIGGL